MFNEEELSCQLSLMYIAMAKNLAAAVLPSSVCPSHLGPLYTPRLKNRGFNLLFTKKGFENCQIFSNRARFVKLGVEVHLLMSSQAYLTILSSVRA